MAQSPPQPAGLPFSFSSQPSPAPYYPFCDDNSLFEDSPRDSPMPTAVRQNMGFIDLTDSSPPTASVAPFPFRTSPPLRDESSRKRRRYNQGYGLSVESLLSSPSSHVDEVDLTRVEDNAGLQRLEDEQRQRQERQVEKLLEQQQAESIRSQHEQSKRPSRMSDLQCVICMENMTDITATHCGHLFCHTCIMEALIAGENQGPEPGKGPSRCPVCRKKVMRSREGRDMHNVIPLELKLLTKSAIAKGKERAKTNDD